MKYPSDLTTKQWQIVTDTMGNLLAMTVNAANIHDTVGGVAAYDKAISGYPSIQGVSGDMGWVAERTFAWSSHSRRLSKDYEINETSEIAWFTISHCHTI